MNKKDSSQDHFYKNAPVNEVICGVYFEPLQNFLIPYLGLLWEKYKPEFTKCQEVPPLLTSFENFDQPFPPAPGIEISEMPQVPRVWLINSDNTRVIQLQRTSFFYNWRKITPNHEYPRFQNVIKGFKDHLFKFQNFLIENEIGNLTPIQYELTYINHIPKEDGWNDLSDLGAIFPDFNWRKDKKRFLPTSEKINLRTSFVLPERTGRLHVSIQSGFKVEEKAPILLLEMRTRGIGNGNSMEDMWKWFEIAHHWIVQGFGDLTDQKTQKKVWRKEK